jgi:hypothetical protein
MKYYKTCNCIAVFFLTVFTGFLCRVIFWPEPRIASAMQMNSSVPQEAGAKQTSKEDNRLPVASIAAYENISDEVNSQDKDRGSLFTQNSLNEISPIEVSPSDSGSSSGFTSVTDSDTKHSQSLVQSDSVASSSVAGSSGTASGSSNSSGTGGSSSSGTGGSGSSGIDSSNSASTVSLESAGMSPSFAVKFSDGTTRIYQTSFQNNSEPWHIDNKELQATVRNTENETWELTIKAKASISEVWFPWHTETLVPSQRASDCIVYYPFRLGSAMRGDSHKQFEWWGMDYPGAVFAPLMVLVFIPC